MGTIRTLTDAGTVLVLCCSGLAAPDIPVDDGVPVGCCSSQLSRRWLDTPWPSLEV